jgi:hypothetical protein
MYVFFTPSISTVSMHSFFVYKVVQVPLIDKNPAFKGLRTVTPSFSQVPPSVTACRDTTTDQGVQRQMQNPKPDQAAHKV